jgi:hypothetical protein
VQRDGVARVVFERARHPREQGLGVVGRRGRRGESEKAWNGKLLGAWNVVTGRARTRQAVASTSSNIGSYLVPAYFAFS